MNQKRYKFYEEIAKQKGKQLFVEECTINIPSTSAVFYDKTKLVEDISGIKFEARGILKKVPVAKYDEKNANGRVYPLAIGKKIHEGKLCEGDDCYGNHADSEESVFDTVGIWHDFILEGNLGYADLYCIGDGGQLLLEKVKAGGKAGFSTVSYGSLKEDDVTVDPETWESGHLADFVAHPSAGVFGTHENIQESTQTKSDILTESKTNKAIEQEDAEIISEKENKRKEQIMLDKIKENEYKDKTRNVIKLAKSATKLTEALEDLKSFKGTVPEELTECHSRIESTIEELAVKLEEQVDHTKKSLQEKESTLEEVTAKYSILEKAHNQLKEDYNKVKTLVERTQSSDIKNMYEDIEQFAKDRKFMESDIAIFKEEIEKRDADIKVFMKERKDMLEDIAIFKKEYKKLKEAVGKCKAGKKKSIKEDEEYSDIDTYGDSDVEDIDFPTPDEDVLDIDMESGEVIDAEDTLEGIDSMGFDDDLDAEALINEDTDETADEIRDEAHEDKGIAGDGSELTEEEDEDEGSDEDEEEDAEEKEKKEESTKIRVRKDVFKHYKECVKKNPSLADVRKEILTSKTLYEAVRKIEKFTESRKNREELITLRESSSFKVPATEKKYVFKR